MPDRLYYDGIQILEPLWWVDRGVWYVSGVAVAPSWLRHKEDRDISFYVIADSSGDAVDAALECEGCEGWDEDDVSVRRVSPSELAGIASVVREYLASL